MVEVGVARRFRARHRLQLQDGSIHEDAHAYRVEAVVRGPQLPDSGMLLDLDDLGAALAACLAELHESDLDSLAHFAGHATTVEAVAVHVWRHVRDGIAGAGPIAGLRVTVFESDDAWAAIDRAVDDQASSAVGPMDPDRRR